MTKQEGRAHRLTAVESDAAMKRNRFLRLLIFPGTDVNQVGRFGERPLDITCTRDQIDEITALLDGGADVNGIGELRNTPLHEAVGQGHIEVVKLLLSRGATATIKNELGHTPLG